MNESLEFTAAACQLAQEIFMARKAAYGITEQWGALTPAIRHIYVKHAADILKAHAPGPTKVIARISPDAPYGETA